MLPNQGIKISIMQWCSNSVGQTIQVQEKNISQIRSGKKNTSRLHEVRSKTNPLRKESFRDMKLPLRPQQKSQSVNASPQVQTSQLSAYICGKRGRSSNNKRPLLQTTFGNVSGFTTLAKVQICERLTTRSQRQDTIGDEDL